MREDFGLTFILKLKKPINMYGIERPIPINKRQIKIVYEFCAAKERDIADATTGATQDKEKVTIKKPETKPSTKLDLKGFTENEGLIFILPSKTKINVLNIKINIEIKLGDCSWNPQYKFLNIVKIKAIIRQNVIIPSDVKPETSLSSLAVFNREKLASLIPTKGRTHGMKFKMIPEVNPKNEIYKIEDNDSINIKILLDF